MTAGRRSPYDPDQRPVQWRCGLVVMALFAGREQCGNIYNDIVIWPSHPTVPSDPLSAFAISPSIPHKGSPSEGIKMDNDILARMEAEEADLTQKLDAVRQFLAAYRGTSAKPARAPTRAEAPTPRPTRTLEERMDKFGPYGHRIVDTAATLLPGRGGNPVPTRRLVEQLTAIGVEITGENKVNSLSALLARSSKTKGYGKAGWTLSTDEAGSRFPFMPNGNVRNENGAAEAAPDAERVAPLSNETRTNENPFA